MRKVAEKPVFCSHTITRGFRQSILEAVVLFPRSVQEEITDLLLSQADEPRSLGQSVRGVGVQRSVPRQYSISSSHFGV